MTLQQLEYLLALEKHGHFGKAAEACNVSQPTLSAMIRQLEEELDVVLFDRTQRPVAPTPIGTEILLSAKRILSESDRLKELVGQSKGETMGLLRLGVIPTVAPYLLPQFFETFRQLYPEVELSVREMRTSTLIPQLRRNEIDVAIMATPLNEPQLLEIPLYYERFYVYVHPSDPLYAKGTLKGSDIPSDRLWLLEESHCFRSQVLNICQLVQTGNAHYEAGSIDTLVRVVDRNRGYTLIPSLHLPLLPPAKQMQVRPLEEPISVREVAMVVREDFVKESMLNAIADTVKRVVPASMLDKRLKQYAIRL